MQFATNGIIVHEKLKPTIHVTPLFAQAPAPPPLHRHITKFLTFTKKLTPYNKRSIAINNALNCFEHNQFQDIDTYTGVVDHSLV